MGKVQLQCRFKKEPSQEDKNYLETQRIIHGENFDEDNYTQPDYDYGKLTIDIKDIRNFNEVDKNHILIRTYQMDAYVIKISFTLWQDFYQQETGNIVKVLTMEEIK